MNVSTNLFASNLKRSNGGECLNLKGSALVWYLAIDTLPSTCHAYAHTMHDMENLLSEKFAGKRRGYSTEIFPLQVPIEIVGIFIGANDVTDMVPS